MKKILSIAVLVACMAANASGQFTIDVSNKEKNTPDKVLKGTNYKAKDIVSLTVIGGPFVVKKDDNGNDVKDTGFGDIYSIFSTISACTGLETLDMGRAVVTEPNKFNIQLGGRLKLKSVILPRGITKIGRDAFGGTSLMSLELPGSVIMEDITTGGSGDVGALSNCKTLENVIVGWAGDKVPTYVSGKFPAAGSEAGKRILYVPDGNEIIYSSKGWEEDFIIKKLSEKPKKAADVFGKLNDAGGTQWIHIYKKNDMQRSLLKAAPEGYTLEATTISDAEGNYAFESLREGVYIIMVEIEGYESQPSAVIVITAESKPATGIDFTVDHEARTVRPVIPVAGVSLNKPEMTLTVGGTETLIATVEPADATNQTVTWGSSNTAAATVSDDGTLSAIAGGTAIITVTTVDGGKTASCTVTVIQPVTGVSLDKPTLALVAGESERLTATVTPADATNQTVTWGSSNTAAATVSDDGTVTAIAAGEAVVTATTRDGAKTATCAVTVQSLTGVGELWNIDLKIYPNPFTGTVRITGADAEAGRAPILRVIDAAGVAVHVQKITNPDETIRLEHLPAGVYFFRLEMDGKAKTVKAIKN